MRSIAKKLGYIPGERGFRTFLWRDCGIRIGRKRIRRLMKEMGLYANRPKKDAYKGQAKHDHPCTAPDNLVSQNFRIAPRSIICTDITYLYYGEYRTLLYLCIFKDAYTKEILGWSVGTGMTTELIRQAYTKMMEKHGKELKKNPKVIIQSDQGSQFLSVTFRKLLEDESYLHSVSARANSQDNAPAESYFSRLKTALIDMMKLCRTSEDAIGIINGYINAYNNEHYQYNLAGLTPHEFYLYTMTGIYPCDSYYGKKATELRTLESIVNSDLERAEKRAEQARELYRQRSRAAQLLKKDPITMTMSDQLLIRLWIKKFTDKRDELDGRIKELNEVLKKAQEAQHYFESMSEEELMKYCSPGMWQKDTKLNYIYSMGGLF